MRYLAHKYGADVTGIELTPARVAGAQELTKRVGLQETARVIEGNVLEVPLADASMDAVVSQEAFCHVPDVKKALTEMRRAPAAGIGLGPGYGAVPQLDPGCGSWAREDRPPESWPAARPTQRHGRHGAGGRQD